MGFTCGIVGLPNVGKSTLFNALTQAGVQAANYPFCTIEPHVGKVPVPDPRLQALAKIANPQRILPTMMEFVDIAGLVKGASKGEGLGNQFLGNIRETEAIAHVVRCFENNDIIHVCDRVDPVDDAATIQTELLLADLETVEKAIVRISKNIKKKEATPAQQALLESLRDHLNNGAAARTFPVPADDIILVQSLHLLTQKPLFYVANVDEDGFTNNPHLTALEAHAAKEGNQVIAICASMEAELSTLTPEEQKEWLSDLGWAESGLDRLIRAGYNILGLQTYFTVGPLEVRAWTIPKGTRAPQAAAVIHTDFETGFIRAEVIHYGDYIQHNGEAGAKTAGKWQLEGKEYVFQEGDVVHFRFNV